MDALPALITDKSGGWSAAAFQRRQQCPAYAIIGRRVDQWGYGGLNFRYPQPWLHLAPAGVPVALIGPALRAHWAHYSRHQVRRDRRWLPLAETIPETEAPWVAQRATSGRMALITAGGL